MNALEEIKCKNLADDIADEIMLTPKLYRAICNTPREIFSPVGAHAYSLNAQPIAGNQWISSPLTVAKMTSALECENIDNVLEIGCGSGYQAAILSNLAHRVFSVERIEKLAMQAKKRFETLKIRNVHVRYDDGNNGWKSYAPYDRILLSAATDEVPQTLFNQLKSGGILVAPIKKADKQYIVQYKKDSDANISEHIFDECLFVSLLTGRE
ncbi:protein-L-isoaspartate(D-aspartate) O-methyltransferase [Campylobacter sp. RM9344]|uniref:Protein-L-isoaspartate O-methyltransferase n=1 Tax=Campylobacter californiensis TaxID=1032243 RepID=A0AAW3ZSR3_9BACT|nr:MULTISPECIES: protein-L-isoaspartate(D-aspartate) O-methyltransferase [unclassified Campylobacter]MBE2985172.1 protein-L-isoaspartate(D-aspartate) O-methyltransferase [Campylobacter sp. RM6883]MBE2995249.1 protein-L-isoaspartate(D-aspartate) O-methyltransferase [Campylobacter sp. RM6913]MBE3029891.1 protein-L-isoaspartate(D-aspartate) O-methyltransferase [Campylobacter sp. RM9344]MBE3608242.1 protein-L-isoaspartate(D-aspartate) O-methyltransferase [Campylobacter sp. RM9337]QCD51592.1 L-isoa